MKYILLLLVQVSLLVSAYSQGARNVYFPVDSIHLSTENVDMLEKSLSGMEPGSKIVFRVLIHDDAKNKPIINELDRKRSLELFDFFIAEGFPPSNVKISKTPGREAKGFISDDMKNLLIYDVEVYKALPAVAFSNSEEILLSDNSMETFQVPCCEPYLIQGSKGVQINLAPGSFEYKTGVPVSGTILFEMKEFVNPGEMAAQGLMTMNEEFPFHAGLMLWIKASVNGKELRLKKGRQISIKIPASMVPADPKLFCGQDNKGLVRWFPSEPVLAGTIDAGGICTLPSSSLHWLTCASMDKTPDSGGLTIKSPVSYNLSIRLILKDQKMVLGAYQASDSKDFNFTHVPVGKKAVLLVYGAKDGKYFFFSKEVLTQQDGKEKIQLKETSMEEIRTNLLGIGK
jgi:hypothetical protein